MRFLSLALFFLFSLVPLSYGQMTDDMEKHMEEMMDMMGTAEEEGAFTKEAEEAGVNVKVTYTNPSEKAPVFSVALDTHTVDLDRYGFDRVVELRDDSGNRYRPEVVSSSGSGHHREAVLDFKDADAEAAKFFEVVVLGLEGVEERVFRFDLKKEMME